jgi:CARDB
MKQLLFATLLCVFSLNANGQVVGPPLASRTGLPDLVVKEITFESAPDQIRVRVMNQGGTASANCHLALMSMAGDDASLGTKQRVWTIAIPALQPGKGFSNTIVVAPLNQSNGPWKALVDRSDSVKESNESNNQLIQRSAAPSLRLPDLRITRAVLIDATEGELSVEVANDLTGTASVCQLRLIVWEMGKFEKKSMKEVFVQVPAIGPLEKRNVKVKAGVPIISQKFSLFIDIGNEVKERNENNNRYEGEAGKS